jgi:hypothetical protein
MDRQVLLQRLVWAVRAGELDGQLADMERSLMRYPPQVRSAVVSRGERNLRGNRLANGGSGQSVGKIGTRFLLNVKSDRPRLAGRHAIHRVAGAPSVATVGVRRSGPGG